jgi:hypothetical protein
LPEPFSPTSATISPEMLQPAVRERPCRLGALVEQFPEARELLDEERGLVQDTQLRHERTRPLPEIEEPPHGRADRGEVHAVLDEQPHEEEHAGCRRRGRHDGRADRAPQARPRHVPQHVEALTDDLVATRPEVAGQLEGTDLLGQRLVREDAVEVAAEAIPRGHRTPELVERLAVARAGQPERQQAGGGERHEQGLDGDQGQP